MKRAKYLCANALLSGVLMFIGTENALSAEDYGMIVDNLPCERVTGDDLARMAGSLHQTGQAFGLPTGEWDDEIALRFRKRLDACDEQESSNDFPLARQFDLVWEDIGSRLNRERADVEERKNNTAKVQSAFDQLDLSASPDAVLRQLDDVQNLISSFPLLKQDRARFGSRLAELRLELQQRKSASDTVRANTQKAEAAAAAARKDEEEAAAMEAKLAELKEKARLAAEAKERQAKSEQDLDNAGAAAQQKLDAASEAQRAAQARKAAAQAEMAKLQQEEASRQQDENDAAKEAAIAQRMANPACVEADKIKKELTGVSKDGPSAGRDPKLMQEMTSLAMEMQAGEVTKGCKRAQEMEETLEHWRTVTAQCSLGEAAPINMSLEPLRRMLSDYGC